MKKTITMAAATLLAASALAGPVGPERASRVAHSFWCNTLHGKADVQLVDMTARWAYEDIYLFQNPQGGFVMVAADDCAKPILGYSMTSAMDVEDMPVQLSEWLDEYVHQIGIARELGVEASARDAQAWADLEAGHALKGEGDGLEPLLTTEWDQYAPYNELCPSGTVTGCAATAQAQMMKYWNYPAFGEGSNSYSHPRYGVQSADFARTLYAWELMDDRPTAVSPADRRLAIATLMYHVGVSLNMSYNSAAAGGSAAAGLAGQRGIPSIDNSLQDYFHYSRDMQVIVKDNGYTDDTWVLAVIDELNLRHPLVYMGVAVAGGHGWVCDGYDTRHYLHFNFGWSGTGNGYYPVDSICPGIGPAGQSGNYTFNSNQAALVGAVPDYALRLGSEQMAFGQTGGVDSVLLGLDERLSNGWSVSCNATWLHLSNAPIERAGWIVVTVDENNTGADRTATVTFTQDTATTTLTVVQGHYMPEDLCPLTVVMESTRGGGWSGNAHLTFESVDGYVFGTAALATGNRDSVQVMVSDHDVMCRWHSGGGSDRYVNYYVRNQYGETLISCTYAYRNGADELIVWPCVPTGIERPEAVDAWVGPNPTTGHITVEAAGEVQRVVVTDVNGRQVLASPSASIDLGSLPAGTYYLQVLTDRGVATERVVKY